VSQRPVNPTQPEIDLLGRVTDDPEQNADLIREAPTQVARLHTFGFIYYNGDQHHLRITPAGRRALAAS
jgi:hypothetical protein